MNLFLRFEFVSPALPRSNLAKLLRNGGEPPPFGCCRKFPLPLPLGLLPPSRLLPRCSNPLALVGICAIRVGSCRKQTCQIKHA